MDLFQQEKSGYFWIVFLLIIFHFKHVMNVFLVFVLALFLEFASNAMAFWCQKPVRCCSYSLSYFSNKFRFGYSSTIQELSYCDIYVDITIVSNVTGSPIVTYPETIIKYRLVKCGCIPISQPADRQIIYTNPSEVYVNESPGLALLGAIIPSYFPLLF